MSFIVDEKIEEYAERHSTPPDPLLAELAEETKATMSAPQMLTGPIEGRFLELLVHASGAKRVLEIGTFTGYSALSMAAALPEGGHIDTLDIEPKHAEVAQRMFETLQDLTSDLHLEEVLGKVTHHAQAAVGGQEHGHGVIGHLVDEHVGHVGDHDAGLGGRVHVHGIRAHAAQPDDFAVAQPLDDGRGDAPVARDDRVGVPGRRDELLLGLGRDLDDLSADRVERLSLDLVRAVGQVKRDPARRLLDDDLELLACGHSGDLLSSGLDVSGCGCALRPPSIRFGPTPSRGPPVLG